MLHFCKIFLAIRKMGDVGVNKKLLSYKTIFLQNIPLSCTNEHLKEVFSTIGAIQEAFVVPPRDREEYLKKKQSLVGFVSYFSHDDAEKAARSRPGTFVIEKRRIKVKFANKKKFSKNQSKSNKLDASTNNLENQTVDDKIADFGFEMVPVDSPSNDDQSNTNTNDSNEIEKDSDNQKSKSYSVCITGFPDNYTIQDFAKIWKLKGFALPEKFSFTSEHGGEAVVEMNKKQAALKVLTNLSGMVIGKNTIKASLALDPDSKEFKKTAKGSRMIIRNLSFQCEEDDLRKVFSKYGNITEINIPLKEDKKKRGYGFVQLTHMFESLKAIKELNMTEIKGRKVAIDLCLPREQYQDIVKSEKPTEKLNKVEDISIEDSDGEEQDSDCEDDDISNNSVSHNSDEDQNYSDDDNEDDEGDESDDVSSNDEDDSSNKRKKGRKNLETKVRKHPSDVQEGKTVFLRNLSFDVTEDLLKKRMEAYGEFNYCLLVMNPDTGFSKGTAFIQFKSKEDAEKCVKKIENESTKLVLDDRRVIASMAQSPDGLKKQIKEKREEAKEKDTRNLYLASEGVVRPGTLGANGLSEVELKKRVRMEMAKRHKLKDPNVIVSTTRLCFHNLPGTVDNPQLRKICKDALKNIKGVKITECRVMRDLKNVKSSGVARSLGFAFINFTKHEHALLALRRLNNNPDIFDVDKRPIIEFTLEDKRALDVKEQRRQRQLLRSKEQKAFAKQKEAAEKSGEEVVKDSVKRKIARIEKLRAMRQAKKGKSDNGNKPSTFKQTKIAVEKARQERQSFEGSSCITAGGKKAPMAKRVGPKIRDRNRGQVLERLRESKKLNKRKRFDNKEKGKQSDPAPIPKDQNLMGYHSYQKQKEQSRRQSKKNSEGKDFDKLVAKYAKRLKLANDESRPKWFN